MRINYSFIVSACTAGILLCIQQTRAQVSIDCTGNWVRYQSGKKATCVWLSSEKSSWIDAMGWCKVMGGHLVEIASHTFNNKLKMLILLKQQKGKYWIGLSDVETEMEYKWMTSKVTSPVPFNLRGQHISDMAKNCVNVDEKGQWTVESCKAEFWFICQKQV